MRWNKTRTTLPSYSESLETVSQGDVEQKVFLYSCIDLAEVKDWTRTKLEKLEWERERNAFDMAKTYELDMSISII